MFPPKLQNRWRLAWTLLACTTALYFLSGNEADNDLWVHLRTGLDILEARAVPRVDSYSYTASGARWIDHEWLAHGVFGAAYRAAGSAGLFLIKFAVGLLTAAVLGCRVWQACSSPAARGAITVLVLAALARGFAVRPQVLAYAATACLLAWLHRYAERGGWQILLLPVFLAVWANTHGGAVLGAAIGAVAAAWLLPWRPRAALALAAATGLGVAAAAVANPYGPELAAYLWRELSASHPITEWQPVSAEAAHLPFFALGAAFLLSLPFVRWGAASAWEALVAAALFGLACRQQRHTPVFAICAAPLVAEGFERARQRVPLLRRLSLSPAGRNAVAAGILALAALQMAIATARLVRHRGQITLAAGEYPVAAVRFLKTAGVCANLAVPLDWGAYALWHLAPEVKVSLDGRFATVYPESAVEDNFAFFSGRDDWSRLLDAYPTDLVLAPAAAPPPVQRLPDWERVYGDRVACVFARRDRPLAKKLAQVPFATVSLPSQLAFP